ncbi:5-(carboxyamino)imidazole ribonucleotide synthase [Acidisphaera sp. L21]|uniref:5-(carboxyamino)imidazole ribonucleotide synthase n=1 Tax=Acidisphaera sp. L21 TaxID=1641851 RepID=UPI00131DADFE|nr:5-(carboxyamino)imidazole ribonucleotide synthase [Acidisphaera sp. L21]
MAAPLPPNATIGIVGGGQLGRMSAMAAARLGYRCHILTPEEDSPASQVSARTFLGDYEDQALLRAFAESVDVVTFEFENVSAEGLDLLQSIRPVRPSPNVLRISQDRVVEKTFLNDAGVATASWLEIKSRAALHAAVARVGLPGLLKTTRGGYDGKGQAMLRSVCDLNDMWEEMAPKPLILEALVKFEREISVIVARGLDGRAVAFDPVENRHRDGILDLTLAPAPITPETAANATRVALKVADALDLVGVLAVEMFVLADGGVLVNEIAPRPHNSGHWTIDACPASQFEMHIRAVAGLPLPPAVRHSDAVMKNLVGPEEVAQWPAILGTPGLVPHLYGKAEARPGRKMGHVTTLYPLGTLSVD